MARVNFTTHERTALRGIAGALFAVLVATVVAFSTGAFTGCASAPTERVEAAQTLKVAGTTAKAGMDAATDLLKRGQISVDQWRKVAKFYDERWQPAFTFAVSAVRSDLDPASPQIVALALEFSALVAQLSSR